MTKDRSVALIPYFTEHDELFMLLQKRSSTAQRQPGYISFFGGGIEGSETPQQALEREIQEELGINMEYSFFCHYEFFGRILDVYTVEISKEQTKTLHDLEGDGIVIVPEKDIATLQINLPDQLILKNFIGAMKYNNPFK